MTAQKEWLPQLLFVGIFVLLQSLFIVKIWEKKAYSEEILCDEGKKLNLRKTCKNVSLVNVRLTYKE